MREQERKKKRRVRTAVTIAFTLVGIGVVIGIMFAVDSCEQKTYLDMGQTYEDGDRRLTPTDMDVFLEGETLYVFFTLEGSGVAIDDLKLDGCEVVHERSVAEKYGLTLIEGEELNGKGTVVFAGVQKG